MLIEYLFSAVKGDMPVGPDDLSRPFKTAPGEEHPFLSLKDYFEAIEGFVLRDHGRPLISAITNSLKKSFRVEAIEKILIRSEKHGALYHLASVEVFWGCRSTKLSVSTAVSETGRAFLTREFEILKSLDRSFHLPYLPQVYFAKAIERHAGSSRESLFMVLTEWFEDYHEWHLSVDEGSGRQRVLIWDLKKGHRFAIRRESFDIFRKAAMILTLYYDTRTFSQIYPWHHAAGDFVVTSKDGVADVKLTTARNYEPVMVFLSEEAINPIASIIYFLMNLSVRMRLDKKEGVGEVLWAEDYSVEACLKGFFEALRIKEIGGHYHPGRAGELLSILRSFLPEEMEKLFLSLLDLYKKDDPDDFSLIKANLKSHVNLFRRTLDNLRL